MLQKAERMKQQQKEETEIMISELLRKEKSRESNKNTTVSGEKNQKIKCNHKRRDTITERFDFKDR